MLDARQGAAVASPEAIVDVAVGFMAAKQLFAAGELGLFEALGDAALTPGELAERLGVPERSCRIVADAMAGLGLVRKQDGRYSNGEAAAAYLSGRPDTLDLRPYLAFWNTISYPHWEAFAETIRTNAPAPLSLEGREHVFFGGVQAFNSAHALMLAEHYDFSRHEHVLDLAGLAAAFLLEAIDRKPGLRGTFYAQQQMVEFARASLGGRDDVQLLAGDPLADELPRGHDCVLLEHVVHRFGPEENARLLARARETVEPGARLLVLDFFLDDAEVERGLDALLAGEYLVIDGTVVYPESEVRSWVEATGWRVLETLKLPGSPRVLVAEAV